MTMQATTERRVRSDGERTRGSILAAAAALATVEGLDRLSIGGLADHIGISKSGLYAHFRSKEALQLATIDTAWATFDTEVVDHALTKPAGRERLVALVDAFLDHLERRVFPGGCFFAATIAELRMRPGPVVARLSDFDGYWLGLLHANARTALADGELPADTDIDQLVFEIESHVLHAHMSFPPTGDRTVLDRVRWAVRHRVGMPTGS
jgi:AcrR family transcriptional regulator